MGCVLMPPFGLAVCLGPVLAIFCRKGENRQLEVQSGRHVEQKSAIRTDVTVDERHEPSEVFGRHPPPPIFLAEHTLNHQRIDIHHRVLQQMQRQHRHLLVFSAMRREFVPCANKNEVVGAVPVLDDIESFLNLTSQFEKPEIAAQKDRPTGLAQLDQRFIGGMPG